MKSTLDFLYSLQKFGMKIGLRNIRRLLKSIANPHLSIKTIHIAGTNGKGSTSSMVAAILTAAGYKVGLYTSPHLVKFNERIRINGKMISDADVAYYTKKLKPQIHRLKATFFEATTAIAFKYFADEKVDFAVIETGLGGRLDSTNVIRPLVSIITSIGKDHTEILGKTYTSIATEKAGIIKRSVPVVVGKMKGIALNTIVQIARKKKSSVLFSSKITLPQNFKIQLKGKHQIANAKAAVVAIAIVGKRFVVGDKAIKEGLQSTSQLTGLRGRFELLQSLPSVLLDVAHNPEGMKVLSTEIKKLGYKKIIVIFAAMKDKDYQSSLHYLSKLNPLIITTQPSVERALSSELLYSTCKSMKLRCVSAANVKDAIRIGYEHTGDKGLLVITGSHFLVGEAIPLLESNKKNA
ncbi:MAG: folylpolyglutamate synthase/dihydrofolate synthase family protein [Bacteroidota bacterium]|nr:folylpolyglutamate synthase/dihydrofolate synthase family protein [Bacteroidota bacterium]